MINSETLIRGLEDEMEEERMQKLHVKIKTNHNKNT